MWCNVLNVQSCGDSLARDLYLRCRAGNFRKRPDADSRVSPKQTHRKQEDRGTTWYRPTAPLSGLSTCVVAFKPIRKVLVDDDGIALEAFLQAPLTRGAKTPLRRHQCRWFPFWSFSTKNWFYGHTGACRLHSTLRTSRCAMEVTVRDH